MRISRKHMALQSIGMANFLWAMPRKHSEASFSMISVFKDLLDYFMYTAGEPLPLEIEDWYFNVIGQKRCVFIDAWGQTGESNYTIFFST